MHAGRGSSGLVKCKVKKDAIPSPPYTPIEPRCKPKRTYGTHLNDRPHVLPARDGKLQQPARPRRAGGRCARLAVEHKPGVRGVVGRRGGRGGRSVVVLLRGWWRWRDGAAVLLWGKRGNLRRGRKGSVDPYHPIMFDRYRSFVPGGSGADAPGSPPPLPSWPRAFPPHCAP